MRPAFGMRANLEEKRPIQTQGKARMLSEMRSPNAGSRKKPAIKGPKMLAGDYSPAFSLDLIAKDLRLVLTTASEAGTAVPSVEALWQLYREGSSRGHGREDLSAVYKVLVELSTRR